MAFDEQSAISEYSGGLARTEAEFLATASIAPLMQGETVGDRERVVVHFADYFDRMRKRRKALSVTNGGDAA